MRWIGTLLGLFYNTTINSLEFRRIMKCSSVKNNTTLYAVEDADVGSLVQGPDMRPSNFTSILQKQLQ